MNKTILLSALSLAIALPAQAQEDNAPTSVKTEGFYAGVDLGFSNSGSSEKASFDLDIGAGIFAGYEFSVQDNLTAAIEVDYYNWGNIKEVEQYESGLEAYFSGYSINVKPKYYVNENFYVAGSLGLGSYSYEVDYKKISLGEVADGTGFVYGLEAGYQHNNGFLARAGYKATSTDFSGSRLESTTIDLSSFYAGIGYKF
ncbi:porin family protein [Vibrio sp. S9_S30]|uniref:outer membrane beta-barrel protein n=1 Tax=Vibrio sp. S9_S30 TaxID=2720226 RepID=UPI00168185A5|nr:outer membrane beta-barrel protein [Vibrio sp. S9_S30]MBD1557435.1 porin family protein [Vibrio sp. S9_S30]